MKTVTFAFAALALALLAAPMPAAAQDAAPKFAVVDLNKVLNEAKAAKALVRELESKRAEFQKEIAREEEALRKVEKDIISTREDMSKEDFEKKRQDFDKKLLAGQKMVQEKRLTLDRAHNDSMAKMRGETVRVVAAIAKEKGYDAVLTQEAVILSRPEMDITGEVIKRLDAEVKKIAVDWSSAKKGK